METNVKNAKKISSKMEKEDVIWLIALNGMMKNVWRALKDISMKVENAF